MYTAKYLIHFQDCLSTFDKNKYITSTCIDESYGASNISHNNMIENQSCVAKCHFESATPSHLNASRLYRFAWPDGVKCGNTNGFHYCVRGKCEVKIKNKSNSSDLNLLRFYNICL